MSKLCRYFPVEMWCFILLTLLTGVLSSIRKGPSNYVKKVGDTVQLICKTDTNSCEGIDWTKMEGSQSGTAFYRSAYGQLNPKKFANYVVSSDARDGCIVTISNLSLTDSGVFTCSEERNQIEEKKNAVLLVIEASPCSPRVLDAEIAKGDSVSISCSVNLHSDYIKPSSVQLVWLNSNFSLRSIASNESASSNLTLPYSSKAEQNETLRFRCSLSLSVNQDGTLYDQSSPNIEICSFPTRTVLYPVTEIKFNENRERFAKGETVLCKAEGHPPPAYEWKDKAEKVVSNVESYTITEKSSPGDVFECTAKNSVKGVPHSISKSLIVVTEFLETKALGTELSSASSPVTPTGLLVAIVGLLLYEI